MIKKLTTRIGKRLIEDERGLAAVEYAVLGAIVVAAIVAWNFPLLLASCGVLQPVKDTSVNHLLDPAVPARGITGASPAIAITRPSLPSYLDRQQLVSRSGTNRLRPSRHTRTSTEGRP